jgi:hypothetical protein
METLEIQETKTRMPLGIIGKLKTNLILIGLRVVESVRAWRVMTTVLDADGKPVLVGLTAAETVEFELLDAAILDTCPKTKSDDLAMSGAGLCSMTSTMLLCGVWLPRTRGR